MELSVYSESRIGGRNKNEDRLYPLTASPESDLFIVCDGMGGAPGGATASNLVAKSISKFIEENRGKFTDFELVRLSFNHAQKALADHASENQSLARMGTTAAVILFDRQNSKVTFGHCGDSRIYWIKEGKEKYRSWDHSSVMDMVRNNILSPGAALTHPKKHLLSRVIGASFPENSEPDVIQMEPVESNDVFLACSDGVWECLADDSIRLWAAMGGAQKLNKELLRNCQKYASDNYSYHLIQIH